MQSIGYGWGALLTSPHPTAHVVRGAPPRRFTGGGKNHSSQSISVPAARSRPSYARSLQPVARIKPTGPARSGRPDDRLHEIRRRMSGLDADPGFTAFNPGYERRKKRRRNADKRIVHPPRHRARRALIADSARSPRTNPPRTRTPVGVPPRLSPKGLLIPKAQRQAMLPGTWPERSILYGRPNRGAETSRRSAGVTPRRACPSPVVHPTCRS